MYSRRPASFRTATCTPSLRLPNGTFSAPDAGVADKVEDFGIAVEWLSGPVFGEALLIGIGLTVGLGAGDDTIAPLAHLASPGWGARRRSQAAIGGFARIKLSTSSTCNASQSDTPSRNSLPSGNSTRDHNRPALMRYSSTTKLWTHA